MLIDRGKFYKIVRANLFRSKLSQSQVEGMEAILDTWEAKGLEDDRWLAYMLATTFHETARSMQPIEEFGRGQGRKYGQKIKHSGVKYTIPDKIYYGRGFVQLTWYENYELMSKILYGDSRLLVEPELALDLKVATEILFEGMTRGVSSFGDFTGKCLEMYFNDEVTDPINARKIINGLDKAQLIAGHYDLFLKALTS